MRPALFPQNLHTFSIKSLQTKDSATFAADGIISIVYSWKQKKLLHFITFQLQSRHYKFCTIVLLLSGEWIDQKSTGQFASLEGQLVTSE